MQETANTGTGRNFGTSQYVYILPKHTSTVYTRSGTFTFKLFSSDDRMLRLATGMFKYCLKNNQLLNEMQSLFQYCWCWG